MRKLTRAQQVNYLDIVSAVLALVNYAPSRTLFGFKQEPLASVGVGFALNDAGAINANHLLFIYLCAHLCSRTPAKRHRVGAGCERAAANVARVTPHGRARC
jgi:hypothetical protein